MAGQGTVAVELLQQLPKGVDVIIVPVGGGGLIGGIAAVTKAWRPDVQVRGRGLGCRTPHSVRSGAWHLELSSAKWGGSPSVR